MTAEVECMDDLVADPIAPLMTAEEAAEVLRVSDDWIYRAARTELIPCVRVGPRAVRFRRADIEAFIDAGGSARNP